MLAATVFALGPTGAYLGLFSASIGFGIYAFGLLLALLGLLVGLIGLWHTRPGSDRTGRPRALSGVGVGLALAAIVALSLGPMENVPTINDISTDSDDPPPIKHALESKDDRDFRYPGEAFARQQRLAYPDLKPIPLDRPRETSFRDAEAAATALGWKINYRNASEGIIEATDTSAIFHFIDDITIRVRSTGKHSVVDLRSRSRTGQGDLGANAARIRSFQERLRN